MNILRSFAVPALLLSSWVALVGSVLVALQPQAKQLPVFVEPMVTIIVPTTTRS